MIGLINTSSPGKIILFGEHAVVYDKLGIASTINLRARVSAKIGNPIVISKNFNHRWDYSESELQQLLSTFEKLKEQKKFDEIKKLNSKEIPIKFILAKIFDKYDYKPINVEMFSEIKKGLGSSSSIFSAIILAICNLLDKNISKEKISRLTYEGDVIAHGGTPSGIDNNVVTFGGYIKYKKSEGFEKLKISSKISLIIVDSGRPSTTAETVMHVRKLGEKKPNFVSQILEKISDMSLNAAEALRKGDREELGKLMTQNHELLKQLGVSTPELNKLVNLALKNNAYGAKLTGSGGGGCIIASTENQEKLKNMFIKNGYKAFITKLGVEGVRVES